ncbi:MAG TPA: MFS transporter [Ilumatobacter sp.]|nr:MFS transporter [Ilumatobacter sp.]
MTRLRVLTFGLMTALLASGYGVMFTVLDDFHNDYGIAEYWIGAIVSVGFFASFFSQVFLAPIADRGYARQFVVAGMVLNVIGLLGMAVGDTLVALLIARVVSGVGIGMAVPAVRRIVINADPDNLGNNVGLLLAADVAGFATGPAISAILVPSFGLSAPFLVIAAATVCCIPVMFRRDIVRSVPGVADSVGQPVAPRFAFDLLRARPMVAALMMGSAVFLMIGTFDALWALVLDDLEASDLVSNLGITIFALPLVFLGSYGGRLAQRLGPFRLGPFGLILGAGFMFLYGFMPTGALMLTVGVVHSISDGFTVSSTGVAVAMVAPGDRQAGAQGMLGASETLTAGITAAMAGVLYSWGGRELAYSTCTALMLCLAVGSFLLAGPDVRQTRGLVTADSVARPLAAVTGHE